MFSERENDLSARDLSDSVRVSTDSDGMLCSSKKECEARSLVLLFSDRDGMSIVCVPEQISFALVVPMFRL